MLYFDTSALLPYYRLERHSEVEVNHIEAAFEQDLQAGRDQIRPLTAVHYERATAWMLARRTSLRALDALHLAFARGANARIVTLDEAVRHAADLLAIEYAEVRAG